MSGKIKVLVFAGSTREGSFNKKLARVAAEALKKTTAEVTLVDLRDYPMPLYDGDLEAKSGLPENAKKFKKLMIEHQAFFIASPEYNSSITGVLKNTLDWASRAESDAEPSLVAYKGKVAALTSASPGMLGGLRSLVTLRSMLGNIGVFILPDQIAVSKANEAFDKEGKMIDAKRQASIEKLAADLVKITGALANA